MNYFVYIMMFIILLVEIYVSYKLYVLYKKLNKLEEGSKKQLNEAGNAIADTLRVVFDNLKRQGSKMDKLSSKHTEYQSRFHRLEQVTQRLLSSIDKEAPTKQNLEEIKNERRNTKAD